MLIHYSVQLRRNFGEIPVQIKRFHTDLIATHPIAVIRLYCFVRCGMHARICCSHDEQTQGFAKRQSLQE